MDKARILLGLRVRQLRRAKDLGQADLAEIVGLSVNYISQIETGAASPAFETLIKLATGLEVELKELFNFSRLNQKDLP